jgi:hypothetical protein
MHRSRHARRIAGLACGLAACCCGLALAADGADDKAGTPVPLSRVVLFNAGVGYFEHKGDVEGSARLDLKFKVDDVNDLLKSMVVEDQGGGHVSTVTYGSRDPVTKALQTFSIDLTNDPSLAGILAQIRGEKIEVEVARNDKTETITGTILGLEKRERPVAAEGEKEVLKTDVLNLLTATGLRSVELEQIRNLKLLNEKLAGELKQALEVLASGHSNEKKTVSLNFIGKGQRTVRVGYVQETPIWKTSYRLVIREDEGPLLQGWAIVENTTEEDWKDVRLSLISGRPIAFRMDLYQPLYVKRPLVVPELYASLFPQVYDQDLDRAEDEFSRKRVELRDESLREKNSEAQKGYAAQNGKGEGRRLAATAGFGAMPMDKAKALDLGRSVQSMANAADVGELFEYAIESPVTLERQRSAMLPIVNSAVKGEKLSIYNESVQAKHPLNGLRMTNTSDLHLMQGPITVFDDGVYAGDARIEDLPPKSERLISYALDLDTEVAPQAKAHPDHLLTVRLAKGLLYATRKYARSTTYTIKNSGKKTKKLLVERHIDPNWKLVTPKEPSEKTRDQYRFAIAAEPGKAATLDVEEEMTQSQSFALLSIDPNSRTFYLNSGVVSDKVKAVLKEIASRQQKLADLAADKAKLEQKIKVIGDEQSRIRQNMAQLDRNTDLYNKYVKKFAEQEDLNDKTRGEIDKLSADEAKQKKSLDEYVLALEVD